MPLNMVEDGRTVIIKQFNAGRSMQKKMANLGLFEGAKIRVVNNSGSGGSIIYIKETKLVLGRGIARKIIVE